MGERRPYSVSEVLGLAKSALESISVRVVGEVSELTDRSGYKAVYFTLCDGDAVLPCLMWRDRYEASGVRLSLGTQVEAEGQMTVYAAKGRMQFQVRSLALAGEGVLRMQVAELARRLESEGLMADERKRALPELPEVIGVVTSPRGKAVHDVLRTLARRYPVARLAVAGVAVEGRDAAESIVAGIEAVASSGAEVLILCRGGGSYEDLMPFNDERVARAVAACPVPVVCGIGHEPDTTIADMVADVRASTPTAAAEAVAPDSGDIARHLSSAGKRLLASASSRVGGASHRLEALASRPVLRDPHAIVGIRAQRLDLAADALDRALPGRLAMASREVAELARRVESAGARRYEIEVGRVDRMSSRLADLSPLGILGRGYSICYGEGGRAVRNADVLSSGDAVSVKFAAGRAACTVDEVFEEGS